MDSQTVSRLELSTSDSRLVPVNISISRSQFSFQQAGLQGGEGTRCSTMRGNPAPGNQSLGVGVGVCGREQNHTGVWWSGIWAFARLTPLWHWNGVVPSQSSVQGQDTSHSNILLSSLRPLCSCPWSCGGWRLMFGVLNLCVRDTNSGLHAYEAHPFCSRSHFSSPCFKSCWISWDLRQANPPSASVSPPLDWA